MYSCILSLDWPKCLDESFCLKALFRSTGVTPLGYSCTDHYRSVLKITKSISVNYVKK